MADYPIPKSGAAYIFYAGLPSQASVNIFQANPALAAGDFKVSIDGGALANLATLPTVTPAAGKMVKFSLSAAEMTGDNITVVCSDAAGAEWADQIFNIQTSARGVADLAFPATSGRSLAVDASGNAAADLKLWLAVAPLALTSQLVQGQANQLGAQAKTDVENSVWDAAVASHVSAGTFGIGKWIWQVLTSTLTTAGTIGKLLVDNIDAAISTRTKPADTQARVTLVDTVTAYTGNTPQTGDAYAALTGAQAEPAQGTPAANASPLAKLSYLFKAWRNRTTQTATTYKLFNDDAVTVDHKATFSDDTTTADRGEVASGP